MFQSTHPHGVRPLSTFKVSHYECFNPRTRMGCDINPTLSTITKGFQSTHPHGVRHAKPCYLCPVNSVFQSTHTHGVRLDDPEDEEGTWRFNPRTRMGCDTQDDATYSASFEFQSTHPHGVRLGLGGKKAEVKVVSIHAPAWGATYFGSRSNRPR